VRAEATLADRSKTLLPIMWSGDTALELLESQITNYSEGLLIWMGRDGDFDSVREHPRFVQMMTGAHARVAAARQRQTAEPG